MNQLKLKNLTKHYGKKCALFDFSFTFTDGVYGILGPNGAGKSTLMYLLTDNLLPDKTSGKIYWNGSEIHHLGKAYRKILGYMPQQQTLYANMTAQQFLGYMAALKGMPRKTTGEKIAEVLQQVELSDAAEKKLGGFSGGMKQRVLIAAAILDDPALILMDEPTAGLDPKQRVQLRRLIAELGKEKIILISTHIVSDIESIAKEILLMDQGTLRMHGTIPALMQQANPKVTSLEALYLQLYGDVSV